MSTTTEDEEDLSLASVQAQDPDAPPNLPWNEDVMSDNYETFAKLVARCPGDPVHPNRPDWIEVKEISLGDPLQALTRGASSTRHTIKKNVPVLCVGDETDLPYLGLVQKIWMESNAEPNEQDDYETCSFWLEMYWLYRLKEAANFVGVDPRISKDKLSGGTFARQREEGSERQILFSCHSTFNDVEQADAVCLDSCLHPVEVHWLLPEDKLPMVYFEDSKGGLQKKRAPGFYVRYFLRHRKEELSTVHPINGTWDHPDTMAVAKEMRAAYVEKAKQRQKKNMELMQKHADLEKQKQKKRKSSDDGGAGAGDGNKQPQKLQRLQQAGRQ